MPRSSVHLSRGLLAATWLSASLVGGAGCSSRRDHAATSSRHAVAQPGIPAELPGSDEIAPRLPCPPGTRASRFELDGAPGWRCATRQGVASGPFFTMFPDGSTELSGAFVDDQLEGRWRRRFRNGQTAEVGSYAAGKKDGTWQLYNERGGLLGDYQMQRGTGVEKRWYLDGQLASERSYADGQLDGLSVVYESGGAVLSSATFRGGQLDGARHVGLPGTLRLDDQWAAGSPRGTRKIWRREFLALELSFDEDGALDGPFTAWRDRYSLRERGSYVRGDRHGAWRWYDRAHALEREGNYFLGLRHGLWRQWEGGRLRMLGRYLKGRPNGVFTFWNGLGRVTGTATMRNGTGKMVTFHDNGVPATKTSMVRGIKHGSYQELSLRGRVLLQGSYREDLRHGRWVERDADGRLLREEAYVAGKLDGVVRRYVGGKLASEVSYAEGQREGDYRELRLVGDQPYDAVSGHFHADRKSGAWIFRDADGAPALEQHYRDGVLDGPWSQREAGVARVSGQYLQGRRNGTWIWRSASGETVRTVTYDEP